MTIKKGRELLARALKSIWLFPALLTVVLIGLTAANINGSSIGVYHQVLFGNSSTDKSLLYGQPKSVRSDEWLQWTQLTVMQSQTGYPSFNHKLGGNGDLTRNPEIPVKGWLAVFRPENWSFFILPFEYAYAFKWWFIMYLLLLSCYFFVLRLIKDQRLLAAILSVAFTLSPFILWWYQSMLFLSFAYGFMIMIAGIRILNREKIPKIKSAAVNDIVHCIFLAYLGASMALLIYPPFSVPVLIACIAFLIGYIIDKKVRSKPKFTYSNLLKRLIPFAVAIVLALVIVGIYVLEHHAMINATAQSLYPGDRRVDSGTLPLFRVIDGFLMPLLQGSSSGLHFFTNQSEAANFILLLPFLIIPGAILQIVEYKKHKKVDWTFMLVQLCGLLFLVRALVPVNSFFYHILLLDRVPNERLVSGMGFVGLIQLVLIIKKLPELKIRRRNRYYLGATFGAVCLASLIITGIWVHRHYPLFLSSHWLLLFFALFFTAIVAAFLSGQKKLGAVLLLLFTLGSSFKILPLNHGLSFYENSRLINAIKEDSSTNSNWITADNLYYINFPLMAGRGVLDGSQDYPDNQFWSQVGGTKYANVYDRQARAVYVTTQLGAKMKLIQPNYFQLEFSCSNFVKNHADRLLEVNKINYPCTTLINTVRYPQQNFYIYKIDKT